MIRKNNCLFLVFLLISLIGFSLNFFLIKVEAWEIDRTGTATNIVDGDTLDVSGVGRIRLADIDCPESGETGYAAATQYLTSLVYQKEVYVDVDDITGTDPYGRIVTVIYVYYDENNLKNVNKALLVAGHAEIWDFDNNEFNPYTWTLYVAYQSNPPPDPPPDDPPDDPPPDPPPDDPPDDTPPEPPSDDNSNNQLNYDPVIMGIGIGAGISIFFVVVIVGLYATNGMTFIKEKFRVHLKKPLFRDKIKKVQINKIVMVEDILVKTIINDLITRYSDNIIAIYGIGSFFDDSLPPNWEKNDLDIIVIVKLLDKIPKQDWTEVRFEKKDIKGHQVWLGFNIINAYQNRDNFTKESFSNYEWSLIELKKPENSKLLYGKDIRDQFPGITNLKFDYNDVLARGLYHLDKSFSEKESTTAMKEFSKGIFKTTFFFCIFFNPAYNNTSIIESGRQLRKLINKNEKLSKMNEFFEEALII